MLMGNASFVTEFILVGLTDHPDLQIPLFFLFLLIYMVTVLGNLGLMTLIRLNPHLHTTMYFFLFNLSFIDLLFFCFHSENVAQLFIKEEHYILPGMHDAVLLLFFVFVFFAISECYLLSVMAYDHFVAIGNPLLYKIAMSPNVCSNIMFGSYFLAFSGAVAHTGCMLRLTFCDANTVNHYLCDILPVLQLSCTSTYVNELVFFIVSGISFIVPSFTIFISYGFIIYSILHINSTEGRFKDFKTCSSHIIAVSMFYGSGSFMYLQPSSTRSVDEGKISSVFYTNVVPMMNPLIYSLRDKDVKLALRKNLSRRKF